MIKENGITLIALAITIIILLILAGVTVATLTGDNGLLSKAEEAKQLTDISQEKEIIELAALQASSNNKHGNIEEQKLQESFKDKNVTVKKSGGNFKIKFNNTNRNYKLKSNGSIEEYEEVAPTSVYAKLDDDGTLYLRATQKQGYNLYGSSDSIQLNWNTAGDANKKSVKKVVIEEKIAPTRTDSMFSNCENLTGFENIENFHTENVTSMSSMFYLCQSLTNIDVSKWDTDNVTNMNSLFNRCKNLENIDVSEFNTEKVTNMTSMFVECTKISSLDVSGFDTSNVTKMNEMFGSCYSLENLDVSKFNTSKVTDMNNMFYCCTKLKKLDVSGFDTSNVANMSNMFNRCRSVLELDVKDFNTSNVKNMAYMFYECQVIKELDVEKWNTSNVTNMSGMFGYCYQLTNLDVSGFETDNVTNMSGMFNVCNSLRDLNMSNKFKINDGTNFDNMFNRFSIIKIKAKSETANKLLNKFDSFTINNFEIVE